MYFKCGDEVEARKVFDKMSVRHLYSWNNMLSAGVLTSGLISLVRSNLRPNTIVVSSLIDMYSKCGNLGAGRQVFKLMGDKQDTVLWNTMMSASAQHGHGIEALQMFEDMVSSGVKPVSTTLVVILNACSHSGLVQGHVRKERAISWVEVGSRVHAFTVSDRLHPLKEEIYSVLKQLADQMEEDASVTNAEN
ncbi:putative pentatricopeptide [Rosa chinensis]|uniref:Putative pentatricopeptide n=1 Tax=Rosa chinensis TaxID=74649 RepID=A0A2P6S9M3_ROSCH|nr:putative pentatricopeptide [Rosa chinensis]